MYVCARIVIFIYLRHFRLVSQSDSHIVIKGNKIGIIVHGVNLVWLYRTGCYYNKGNFLLYFVFFLNLFIAIVFCMIKYDIAINKIVLQ